MKRASVNYWVDFVTAGAFVVCAVSGILFLLPASWWTSGGMLGLSAATWHVLHDWSGVLITAGVAGHLVLHWRWIWKMTRREFSDEPSRTRRAPETAVAPSHSLVDGEASGKRQRLYARRDFLSAALAAGAVAFVGIGLLTRDASGSGSSTTQAADGSEGSVASSQGSATSGQDDGSGYGQDGYSQSQGSGSSGDSTRVVVDSSRCVGCGRCFGACPTGVFAWGSDGRTVTAVSPDACRLCGRCLQVCSPQAITINA